MGTGAEVVKPEAEPGSGDAAKADLRSFLTMSTEERTLSMEINVKGTTAEIIVLLNMLEQRPAILDTNKITEEAINEMKDKIPLGDNLLLNIFKNEH